MTACCPRCDGAGTVPEIEVFLADGPCEGYYLCTLLEDHGELPETLRAVMQADGESAVLDLPEDRVEDGERLHEYVLVGRTHVHGPKMCRQYVTYESHIGRLADEQRAREVFREIDVQRGRAHPKRPATVHTLERADA